MVTWTPEKDAKLFLLIIQKCAIKIPYAEIAEAFGEGVTAKALTHRINNLKNKASISDASSGDAGVTSPESAKAPRGKGKKANGVGAAPVTKKRKLAKMVSEEPEDDTEVKLE